LQKRNGWGKKLGDYVVEALGNSVVLHGKIRFTCALASIPYRSITSEEIAWAEMVNERDRNLSEDMFDGIPDKTYARMIMEMKERKETDCEILLQGMAIHNLPSSHFPERYMLSTD
jgi:UDP-galactopyranose mutase